MYEEPVPINQYENQDGTDRVTVYTDPEPRNPREWESNATVILAGHRRYNLGDEQFTRVEELEQRRTEIQEQGGHAQPIYMYDHSGITVSTSPFSDPWDSGQIGWVGIEKKKLDELKITIEDTDRIKSIVDAEMKTWDEFLTGNVYAFRRYQVTVDEHGEAREANDDDHQVHGFFGTDNLNNGMLEHAGIAHLKDDVMCLEEGWKEVTSWSIEDA